VKKTLLLLLAAFAGGASGSDRIALPTPGRSSAASIIQCQSQVAASKKFQKSGDQTGTGYQQINRGADSFVYLFTGPAEPAHPAMIKMTFHPMADLRHPQENDIEFFGAYAGKEEDFLLWSRKIMYDFGRGFGTAVSKKNGERQPR
jgi:hypothetical protein